MKLYISTPAYDSKVAVDYCNSLIQSLKVLEKSGIECVVGNKSGDCYIAKARNSLTREFLESDCTHLLFIDADVGWEPDKIGKIVQSKYDVCLGAYPMKIEYEKYPLHIATEENGLVIREGDYIRLHMGPTGFMCIKREVFTGISGKEYISEDGPKEKDYFQTGVNLERWWGEDSAFCKLVTDSGFQIWCYTDIDFRHWGTKCWTGNCKRKLDENTR